MNAKMFYKSFRENFKIGKSKIVMDAYCSAPLILWTTIAYYVNRQTK